MPSVQLHIKDHPEYAFTGNYSTTQANTEGTQPCSQFEIQKATQPVEAFQDLIQGDTVTFVSASGEAEEMVLSEETAAHIVFISRR
ncbi:hypothetical protein [Mixta intestinalis]|uniref:Uncharacterized protein n=1 Tax=Mixta intestinalis TaxID=1615494 RepID=A0A6P1PW51_9GAMM|nr:hypothetical protein [Mixta intestinalis]QHM70736.1 hypothetical protein C7M51_01014 [Mixta intestinalis]